MVADTSLEDLSLKQLRALAEVRGVAVPAKHVTKAELIALLRAAKKGLG